MSEHSNPQKMSLREKLKNTKINRTSLITAVMLMVAIAIIISVTVATNRAKKKDELPADTTGKSKVETTVTPSENDGPADTATSVKPPEDTQASQVENKLPSFILPVSGVLSKKHDAELQVYSSTLKDYRVHLGVDIVTEENAPVYAAADGKISRIWSDDLMGYCLAIEHTGNCFTIYQNLAEELPSGIKEGTTVRAGQLIASVGDSAMIEIAEEPHLHFEMTVGDLSVDPLQYFNEKALESLSIDASFGE